MKILCTGGLGAVGTWLVKELRGRGHEVWIMDRPHHHDAQYVRGDVGEFRQFERVVEGRDFDYVYHLAAEFGRWNGEDFYETLWRTNAIGTKNLLRLQERLGFRSIFFSSSEVYGDYDGVMVEDVMDRIEIRQMNDYAMTKWVGEQQVLNSAAMHGTETVRVRLFNTYGPGEPYSRYRSAICIFAYHALHDMPFTVYMGHLRTSTFVSDTTRTLANIVDHFSPGEVYNVGGLDLHDMETPARMILESLGKPASLATFKEGEPFTTKEKRVDCSKAIRDLAHAPRVTIEEGIPRTLDWMKAYYKVMG
ncbi:MAG TPA: NAD(P)-dependent oxidoreductase [Longimicrobiales bacterium]|nr:NAD(P)-dependent oxidoreductase [Longimicrobiales bacterium]